MAYIELHQALFDHRKTIVAAEFLDMQEVHLVGHLAALWTWCLDNCPDGVLPESRRVIARGARWIGDPDQLVSGLLAAGFIEQCPDGRMAVHDWDQYGGKLIEKRRANAEKQARYRERQADPESRNHDVTVTKPSRNALEKSREEKSITPLSPPKGEERAVRIPDDFAPDEPRIAWAISKGFTEPEIAHHTEAFTTYWQSEAGQRARKRNWQKAWQTWLLRETPGRWKPGLTTVGGTNSMPPEIARLPWNSAARLKWEHDHREAS